MPKPVINLVGQAVSPLDADELTDLMAEIGAVLEGMNFPANQQMRRNFKLNGTKHWVTFTLERKDDDQCLVRVHSVQ
jgi:hypothetical protein